MANEEHKHLASFLKDVHLSLRKSSAEVGVEKAWHNHCSNKEVLNTYAQYMEKLATTHWERNSSDEQSLASSRISWAADFAYEYFINKSFMKHREKEIDIGNKINIKVNNTNELYSSPITLLDVGSCYNPFRIYDFLDVLVIDLCPANDFVFECDFLHVPIESDTILINNKVKQLKENFYNVVTFCFLLEYIPSSELRVNACERAYKLLKDGGLLLISTPDSKHVGANSKLMKCWRYTLSIMGFSRIKYEKLKHMHCMAFRKCLNKEVAVRWATLHKEMYMDYCIHIPQDYSTNNGCTIATSIEVDVDDFRELPFDILS
ncbi:S-adenosylmethionine sensor upstream of mTORC1 [Bicyclus anynana]|uniref:S-adenosylmethionine sensor upstream of mTORC1 n=1 Tax=Bicyclus anynana TaxID=110368 RepID=A0A6J1P0G2_BICAN|nr:S-adenosylmethionine sensor upstream of mTORC1 [Bicyclus anynana]